MQVELDPNSWTQWALKKTDESLKKGDLLNVWVVSRAMGAGLTAVSSLVDVVRELTFTAEAIYDRSGLEVRDHLFKVAVHVAGVAVAILVGLGSPTELLRTMAKMGCYDDANAKEQFSFKRTIGAALIGLAIVGTAAYTVQHFVLPAIQKAGLSTMPGYWTQSPEYQYMRKKLEGTDLMWLDPADFARLSKMPLGDRIMVGMAASQFLEQMGVILGIGAAGLTFVTLAEEFKDLKRENLVDVLVARAKEPKAYSLFNTYIDGPKIGIGKVGAEWWSLHFRAGETPFVFHRNNERTKRLSVDTLKTVVSEIYKICQTDEKKALKQHVASMPEWKKLFADIDAGSTKPKDGTTTVYPTSADEVDE